MAISSSRDVNFIKLKSLKKADLFKFCNKFIIESSRDVTQTIANILEAFDNKKVTTTQINDYIRDLYKEMREGEIGLTGATHQKIIEELDKVDSHIWGMIQGAVDSHIQANYVRKYFLYNDIVNAVSSRLYDTIKSYTLCTWYNHWSTVFLEDLICENKNVVPIIKKVKGVDVIWNEQPVDIKVTNLPKEWFKDKRTIDEAIKNPILVAKYLYEYQGEARFGDDNRLFILIYDKSNPSESWKIKRDYELIKKNVGEFFEQKVELDAVNFSYGKKQKKQYQAHSKVLFIVK
ncbi:MAG: hypothetical protein US57_C0011G0124 [Candidatus Moranbacteria bacterium GW2011_GWC2_37_73]|nr:MAG: hypothetical protein UR95_C0006G0056 [Parcubacteria group bacterium GW2011_GWC1_36_108]KKQ00003.1 MAG: hypothetical protein US10_C0045G0003 [Candidatus Moranbacteria bacterium GW2011_GWD2_36_198]KKQ00448.1 MAG: hypothetical protein US09_C0011G0006 [Candidatus Moranbacteria bacterium GW2011_GWD1_36_198]KKQ39636.1 MAG: hypothetical protein US57_C0011G0124 [Candidatus Moranbacteria bacterium GW2011_GWC2_37_73]HAR99933.1 hypothetical protein [Candidatus Moranbacteria bacterium]